MWHAESVFRNTTSGNLQVSDWLNGPRANLVRSTKALRHAASSFSIAICFITRIQSDHQYNSQIFCFVSYYSWDL